MTKKQKVQRAFAELHKLLADPSAAAEFKPELVILYQAIRMQLEDEASFLNGVLGKVPATE